MSPSLGSHPLRVSSCSGLFPVSLRLRAQCQGKGLMQSSLGDTVGSLVPGLHVPFLSLTTATGEKVGRKEGTGSHPLERSDLCLRLRCGHYSPIPSRFHPRLKAAGPGVWLWARWMAMPQLLFPFPGDLPACRTQTHRCADTQYTEGLAGGGAQVS